MAGKAAISLSTGLEDPEKVTVAFLVAVGAAGSRRRFMVCPVSFNAKQLDQGGLLPNAELAGSLQLREWIGDEGATTFSY
jgi:predicted peroxiredoxin